MDIALFSLVAVLWTFNLFILWCLKRSQNRLITGLLYSIIGLIVTSRILEVVDLEPYNPNKITVVTGIVATYAKIALGCCSLAAMFQIKF